MTEHPTTPQSLEQRLEAIRAAWNAEGPALLPLAATRALAVELGVSPRAVELAALRQRVLPARYRRSLGTVGWEGQARLLEATAAVVGCGGLGGWAAEALARMGVGRLLLIDGDSFTEDNLNRQLGCTEATLGRPKATALAERLTLVNGAVEITAHVGWLTAENAPQLLAGAQIVVDALDSVPARRLLQAAAAELGIPMVHGAIAGYTGQVMTIFPGDLGLAALYPASAPARGVETQLGNPCATPMLVAAWQAHEVIKYLTGESELLRGRILLIDALAGEMTEIQAC